MLGRYCPFIHLCLLVTFDSEKNMNPKHECLRKREEGAKNDDTSGLTCSSTSLVSAALNPPVGQQFSMPSPSAPGVSSAAAYEHGAFFTLLFIFEAWGIKHFCILRPTDVLIVNPQ